MDATVLLREVVNALLDYDSCTMIHIMIHNSTGKSSRVRKGLLEKP